jgi:DNA-binding CsgD family transcriptional regulator/tetratricopeptide (TPR) repeat protein
MLRESLAAAEEVQDPDDLAAAYIDLAHVLGRANLFDEAVDLCREGHLTMRRVGLLRQEGGFLQANAAECLIRSGRWDEGGALLEDALAQEGRGLRSYPMLIEAARLATGRGALAEAQAYVDRIDVLLAGTDAPAGWRRELAEVRADLLLWQGRASEAAGLVADALQALDGTDEQHHAGLLLWLGVRAAGDPEAADAVVRRAVALDPTVTRPSGHLLPQDDALAATILAELERLRGSSDSAVWRAVASAWDGIHHAFPAAYARWRAAEASTMSRAAPSAVTALVRDAHDAAAALGATGLVAEVEHLARWAKVDLLGAEPGAGHGTLPQEDAGSLTGNGTGVDLGLTQREQEILERLVAGRSNGEIAAELFISRKTASVHVSNILRKLGVSSRAEAARIGHRHGVRAPVGAVGGQG